jgi:transcriptional regulator with XRE-family HTH domain
MRQSAEFSTAAVIHSAQRLGERIRLLRKAKRLTLTQLEGMCRIHRTTLGRLERGELGVSISVLLTVLETLGELADVELLISQPALPAHQRRTRPPVLEQDF